MCGSTRFETCIDWDLPRWVTYVQTYPKASVQQVRDYCKSPFANICAQWAVTPALQVFSQPVCCSICGKVSKSSQAHALHMFRGHGVKCKFRRYVPFTHCVICLREFWSRERCLNHVKKSKVCKFNLLMQEPLLSQEQADSLDQECSARNRQLHAAGRRRHATDLSAIRLQGPLLPILLSESMVSPHHPLGVGQRHC